jgi:hypothetical protein
MAELERLKADEKTYKVFSELQATTKTALEKALLALKEVGKDS